MNPKKTVFEIVIKGNCTLCCDVETYGLKIAKDLQCDTRGWVVLVVAPRWFARGVSAFGTGGAASGQRVPMLMRECVMMPNPQSQNASLMTADGEARDIHRTNSIPRRAACLPYYLY